MLDSLDDLFIAADDSAITVKDVAGSPDSLVKTAEVFSPLIVVVEVVAEVVAGAKEDLRGATFDVGCTVVNVADSDVGTVIDIFWIAVDSELLVAAVVSAATRVVGTAVPDDDVCDPVEVICSTVGLVGVTEDLEGAAVA